MIYGQSLYAGTKTNGYLFAKFSKHEIAIKMSNKNKFICKLQTVNTIEQRSAHLHNLFLSLTCIEISEVCTSFPIWLHNLDPKVALTFDMQYICKSKVLEIDPVHTIISGICIIFLRIRIN